MAKDDNSSTFDLAKLREEILQNEKLLASQKNISKERLKSSTSHEKILTEQKKLLEKPLISQQKLTTETTKTASVYEKQLRIKHKLFEKLLVSQQKLLIVENKVVSNDKKELALKQKLNSEGVKTVTGWRKFFSWYVDKQFVRNQKEEEWAEKIKEAEEDQAKAQRLKNQDLMKETSLRVKVLTNIQEQRKAYKELKTKIVDAALGLFAGASAGELYTRSIEQSNFAQNLFASDVALTTDNLEINKDALKEYPKYLKGMSWAFNNSATLAQKYGREVGEVNELQKKMAYLLRGTIDDMSKLGSMVRNKTEDLLLMAKSLDIEPSEAFEEFNSQLYDMGRLPDKATNELMELSLSADRLTNSLSKMNKGKATPEIFKSDYFKAIRAVKQEMPGIIIDNRALATSMSEIYRQSRLVGMGANEATEQMKKLPKILEGLPDFLKIQVGAKFAKQWEDKTSDFRKTMEVALKDTTNENYLLAKKMETLMSPQWAKEFTRPQLLKEVTKQLMGQKGGIDAILAAWKLLPVNTIYAELESLGMQGMEAMTMADRIKHAKKGDFTKLGENLKQNIKSSEDAVKTQKEEQERYRKSVLGMNEAIPKLEPAVNQLAKALEEYHAKLTVLTLSNLPLTISIVMLTKAMRSSAAQRIIENFASPPIPGGGKISKGVGKVGGFFKKVGSYIPGVKRFIKPTAEMAEAAAKRAGTESLFEAAKKITTGVGTEAVKTGTKTAVKSGGYFSKAGSWLAEKTSKIPSILGIGKKAAVPAIAAVATKSSKDLLFEAAKKITTSEPVKKVAGKGIVKGVGKAALKGIGGLLRKVPYLGALIEAGFVANDIRNVFEKEKSTEGKIAGSAEAIGKGMLSYATFGLSGLIPDSVWEAAQSGGAKGIEAVAGLSKARASVRKGMEVPPGSSLYQNRINDLKSQIYIEKFSILTGRKKKSAAINAVQSAISLALEDKVIDQTQAKDLFQIIIDTPDRAKSMEEIKQAWNTAMAIKGSPSMSMEMMKKLSTETGLAMNGSDIYQNKYISEPRKKEEENKKKKVKTPTPIEMQDYFKQSPAITSGMPTPIALTEMQNYFKQSSATLSPEEMQAYFKQNMTTTPVTILDSLKEISKTSSASRLPALPNEAPTTSLTPARPAVNVENLSMNKTAGDVKVNLQTREVILSREERFPLAGFADIMAAANKVYIKPQKSDRISTPNTK